MHGCDRRVGTTLGVWEGVTGGSWVLEVLLKIKQWGKKKNFQKCVEGDKCPLTTPPHPPHPPPSIDFE